MLLGFLRRSRMWSSHSSMASIKEHAGGLPSRSGAGGICGAASVLATAVDAVVMPTL